MPQQWNYNDPLHTTYFNQFAAAAGCAHDTNFEDAFHCLVEQDYQVLMDDNWNISYGAKYGQWALLPVMDIKFVEQRPSEQLGEGNLNSNRALIGICASSVPETPFTANS